MTKPTQAQIEAAAKALCKSWPKDPNGCAALCMDRLGDIPKEGCRHAVAVHGKRASAALTAAAQVGEQGGPFEAAYQFNKPTEAEAVKNVARELNAELAAQVGEQSATKEEWIAQANEMKAQRDKIKAELAATIERCAQVADSYSTSVGNGYETAIAIAAAIRKLKDAP